MKPSVTGVGTLVIGAVLIAASVAGCGSSSPKPRPQEPVSACVADVVEAYPSLTLRPGEMATSVTPGCSKLTSSQLKTADGELEAFTQTVLVKLAVR